MKYKIIAALLLIAFAQSARAATLPRQIMHNVPFTSQAPYANWKQPYQDACEEASVVMAAAWVQKKSLTKRTADRMIRDLVSYQIKTYGDYKDTNAEATARFARDYYALNTRVVYDVDHEDIRAELAAGNIVIAPIAGRLLNNPYFTQPGPAYHMVVFIGYNDTRQELITNDPGTRRGKRYRYPYATIDRALHDWTPLEKSRPGAAEAVPLAGRSLTGWTGSKETIVKGRSAMIVIAK